jgi:hypothetical protein
MGAVLLGGVVLQRRWRGGAIVWSTFVAMMLLQAVAIHGYARSAGGASEVKAMADAIWADEPDALTFYWHNRRAPNDLSIYLDRITPQVKDPSRLAPSDRPQVVVMLQKERDPVPVAPQGWQFVTRVPRGRDWLCAFVRAPTARLQHVDSAQVR